MKIQSTPSLIMGDAKRIEDLKAIRTKGRAEATKRLNKLKSLYDQMLEAHKYDLSLAIHKAEEQLSILQDIETKLSVLGVEDDSSHVQDLKDTIFQ